jgi:hypothetical protein
MNAQNQVAVSARSLAASGFSVFPCCYPSKAPATPHGFKDAVNEPSAINQLWEKYPGPLIGVATGAPSNVVIVDVDSVKHPEADMWEQVNRERLGRTLTYRTQSGGSHRMYRYPIGLRCSQGRPARGVDIRGDGGYAIFWPAAGCEIIDNFEITQLPAWLLAELVRLPTRDSKSPMNHAGWFDLLPPIAKNQIVMVCFDHIDNTQTDERDPWRNLLFAARDAEDRGATAARQAAFDWSKRGAGFNENARKQFDKIWDSDQTKGDRIGVGTLIHLATASGAGPAIQDIRTRRTFSNIRDVSRVSSVTGWGEPDMTVLHLTRQSSPAFPLDCLGRGWARWVSEAADAAAAPVDYVVVPLLVCASALIGNARWAQATPGWAEPPNVWACVVGDSGSSKSPGGDCILGDVMPEIERRMQGDFPVRYAAWRAESQMRKAFVEQWEINLRSALKAGQQPPLPPVDEIPPEPQAPRLIQNDVTIEKVATLLATAAPKGLLLNRDELAGWLLGMNNYNDSGRAFWLEAYGGRAYRVERQKHPQPIIVPRLNVSVLGGTQPERLAKMLEEADDGLLARLIWAWPKFKPFRMGKIAPNRHFAINSLDKLRILSLTEGTSDSPAMPIIVPLADNARPIMEDFGRKMQEVQQSADGLLRSAYGKARGLALRLSLIIEHLRWCVSMGDGPPPSVITEEYPMRAPHSFGRDYGTTGFCSGSCVALFHIELPDFWNDQRDIMIGVF